MLLAPTVLLHVDKHRGQVDIMYLCITAILGSTHEVHM